MKKLMIVALATLTLFGCTSGDKESDSTTTVATDNDDNDVDDTSTTEPDDGPTPTGPSPGVTDDAILVGVNIVDTSSLAASGLAIETGDVEGAYRALVADINAKGGIHGRDLELAVAYIDPTNPQPAEDACLELTEDADVFVTVGFFLGDAVLCTIEAHASAVVGGTHTPQNLERAKAPWISFEGSDGELDAVRKFHETGALDGSFALISNVNDGEGHELVLDLLDELGVEPVATAVLDAPANDTVAMQNAVSAAAQSFEAAGADSVLTIGQAPTQWATNIQDLDYRPTLLSTSDTIDAFNFSEGTRDLSVLDGAMRAGPFGPQQAVYEEANMQACIEIIEAAGVEIIAPDDAAEGEQVQPYFAAFDSCRHLTLLTALLEAAGPDLNYGTFQQAAEELGEIAIPGDPVPANYGPDSLDGNIEQHLYAWNSDTELWEIMD